jgi:anti-sigma factor RsiW
VKAGDSDLCALAFGYVDGTLDAKREADFVNHLSWCAACHSDVSAYRRLTAGVRGLGDDHLPDPDFEGKVWARIREDSKREAAKDYRQEAYAWVAIAFATGLLVAALCAWLLF